MGIPGRAVSSEEYLADLVRPGFVHSFRSIFSSLREDHLLEDLETIADDVTEHGWKLENLEIS